MNRSPAHDRNAPTKRPVGPHVRCCNECGAVADLMPVYDTYSADVQFWLCRPHHTERLERLARFYDGE